MAPLPPPLVTLNEHKGDWKIYLDALYQYYMQEIVHANLIHNDLMIKFKYMPAYNGKGFAFWHLISEGETEKERTPCFRRCERIRWIPWVIRNAMAGCDHIVTWWENKRDSNTHIVLFFEAESYVVILAKRAGYYLFKTAYVANEKRKGQLIRERERYWESKKTKGAS